MSIGDKFTGLDMEELIGKPLKAADEAKKDLIKVQQNLLKKLDLMTNILNAHCFPLFQFQTYILMILVLNLIWKSKKVKQMKSRNYSIIY